MKIILWTLLIFSILFFSSCHHQRSQNLILPEEKALDTSSEMFEKKIENDNNEETGEKDIEVPLHEYLTYTADGNNLVFENILAQNEFYTRYQISYVSEGFHISGIMNIPKNRENAPLLILNHGYIDPAVYTLGRGLKREQDYFARNGFAVLHTDYRNHAFSDTDSSLQGTGSILRSKKYWADAINAVLAVQNAKATSMEELKSVNPEKVWMLGHSMGGGVTMYSLVAAPELIDAAILYAPVHSNEYYNYQKWGKNRLNTEEKRVLETLYGDLETPESFTPISPENYFENIKTPIQMYFGTNDESCPIDWGYEIETALTESKKDIEFIVYPWEQHEFGPQWQNFMESSTVFFTTELQGN